mmetsp:Transcript_67748/g.220537  ORF Transcript_67748/g.220537 Transcript_67748/m.220537 type:complete len:138 (-) Transcript_67748:45-458(-)
MELIRGEETAISRKFDVVIMVRADITVYFSFKPFCMYGVGKPRRVRDWFYLAPRDSADFLFSGPYRRFYDCQQELRIGGNVDEYINPFIQDVTEDGNLPIMITRLDLPRFPNNMCDRFRNPGALNFDPNPQVIKNER